MRLKLSDGSTVDVGPSAPPPPAGISPRAVISVQSNLPDPPTIVYEQGEGFVLGVAQNPTTFAYAVTCADAINDENTAAFATIRQQGSGFQSLTLLLLGGNDLIVQGRVIELDGEGGITISVTSLDFSLVIY